MAEQSSVGFQSEYEKQRLLNIKRNEVYLQAIGLIRVVETKKSKENRKRQIDGAASHPLQPLRRSSRVSTMPAPNYTEANIPVAVWHLKNAVEDGDDLPVGTEIGTEGDSATSTELNKDAIPALRSDRCADINAQTTVFLDLEQHAALGQVQVGLCRPVQEYGKAAVMALSNGGVVPRFSKYAGAVEWRNCVYLWVNIGVGGDYQNSFSAHGKHMMWFGGSRMHADSAIVRRLLQAKLVGPADGARGGGKPHSELVLLFARLEGEGYCCLGRVLWVAADLHAQPVRFKWELVDHTAFQDAPQFQRMLREAGCS